MPSGALRLIAPTPEEVNAINRFADSATEVKHLQSEIGRWEKFAKRDLDEVIPGAQALFTDRNLVLESTVDRLVDNEFRSSFIAAPVVAQPRLLARVAPLIKSVDSYIRQGFGRPEKTQPKGLERLPHESMRDLLCAAFWEEIGIVRESELLPNSHELLNIISQMRHESELDEQTSDLLLDNSLGELHSVVAKSFDDVWMYYVIFVLNMEERHFKSHISFSKNLSEKGSGEALSYFSPTLPIFSARVEDVTRIRRDQRSDRISRMIFEAKRAWNSNTYAFSFIDNFKYNIEVPYEQRYIDLRISQALARYLENKDTDHGLPLAVADFLTVSGIELSRLPSSYSERLKIIDDFNQKHPGEPTSALLKLLLPALMTNEVSDQATRADLPLPPALGPKQPSADVGNDSSSLSRAPELWPGGKATTENPAELEQFSVTEVWPNEAPIRWRDRLNLREVVEAPDEPGTRLFAFLRAVYGPWLNEGISKRNLRKLDAALVNELNTWTRSGHELPSDVKLLTVGEENRRLLDAGAEAVREHLGGFTGDEALREAARLKAAQRRQR